MIGSFCKKEPYFQFVSLAIFWHMNFWLNFLHFFEKWIAMYVVAPGLVVVVASGQCFASPPPPLLHARAVFPV